MLKLNRSIGMGLLACSFAMLAACSSTLSNVDNQGKTADPVFPAMDQASRSEGTDVNLENLGKVAPGVTKRQLLDLLGAPHFSEGMFGVREWDYILKFREPDGKPDKVCQYKVLFDDRMLARSFYFKPADCMQSDSMQAAKTVPAEAD